jgi:tripartite-type tricarboxylate transporter receptor subunit TctC
MMLSPTHLVKLLIVALLGMSITHPVLATDPYPAKPITLIVPYGPKSDSDYYARAVVKHIAPYLGNPAFVIEHQAGESGTLAAINLKAAKPDGYTLMLGRVGTQVIAPAMDPKLPYRWHDFTNLGLLAVDPQVCAVRKDAPYKTVRELTQAIRKAPGTLKYGTTGNGTIQNLGTLYLLKLSGLKANAATPVEYQGGKAATDALADGEVDFLCSNAGTFIEAAKARKIHPLFTTSSGRIPEFPELQNAAEAGVRDMGKLLGWSLLVGPPGMPPAVIARWKAALKELSSNPEWHAAVTQRGGVQTLNTGKDNERFIKEQAELYENLMRGMSQLK